MPRSIPLVLIILLLVTWSLPTITGYLNSEDSDDRSPVFLGWIRADDFHRYGSFIDQTRYQNRLIYWDYSSVEPQKPRMIALYFFILGLVGKLTGLRAEHLWFISLFITGTWFFHTLKRLLTIWLRSPQAVAWAFFFLLFAGGFESIAIYAGVDFPREKNYWMDGFSTFCSFHNPLKIAGITMVMAMLVAWQEYLNTRKRSYLIETSIWIIGLWLVHPNSALPGYCAIFCAGFWKTDEDRDGWRRWSRWHLFLPLLIPLGAIVLYIFWMKSDPTTANIIRQYSIPSMVEPFRYYPIRYGWALPLGLIGLFGSRYVRDTPTCMIAGWWLGAEMFSHFAGMSGLLFQHMVHLPMALFAVRATEQIRIPSIRFRWVAIGFLAAGFIIQDVGIIRQVIHQTREDVWPTSLYWTKGERMAAESLRSFPAGNVLVSRNSGNKVGWLALQTVFLGHWGTTPQKGEKNALLIRFFDPATTTEWRLRFLESYRIRYIWYGMAEQQLGLPDPSLSLKPLISNDAVTVFEFGSASQTR